MENSEDITIAILILVFHLIANGFFSKIVLGKEPSTAKRMALLSLLWLMPVIGPQPGQITK